MQAVRKRQKVWGFDVYDLRQQMRSDQLIATDSRGRVLVAKERREALLDEFERSGVSGVEFEKPAELKYPTFRTCVLGEEASRSAAGERQ